MKNRIENPVVSVVIPVKNGVQTLRDCLNGIFSQTLADHLEVIIIDSGSTDGTLELLKEYPVIVHSISPKSFNHGDTRNIGASLAKGEFIVFTVQDAIPCDNSWLETLVAHFDDPKVDAVCGQQVVDHHPSKNPLQWFRPAGLADVYKVCAPHFDHLSDREKHELCRWDDVNAAYRRNALKEIPFRNVSFGEDTLWAKDALTLGKTIVYDYRARVWHYHHQSFKFYFKRSYIIYYLDYRHFNYLSRGQFYPKALAKITYNLLRMQMPLTKKAYWIGYNIRLITAKTLAKMIFKGYLVFAGENGIDRGLKTFCQQIPQGTQKKLNAQFS